MLSDYNCRIFDISRFNFLNTETDDMLSVELEKAKDDIVSLTRCGFHRFVCHVRHNQDISTAYTKANIKRLHEIAQKTLPRDCGKISLNFVPKLYFSPDAPYIKNIHALAIKNTNRIFVELPLDANPCHVPETLTRLLYHCNLVPVFTEFQLYAMLYDPKEIEKMLRIKGAAFQFNIKNICERQNLKLIKKILKEENTVLLGTNCSHEHLNVNEIAACIQKFKRAITDTVYRDIVINAGRFLK